MSSVQAEKRQKKKRKAEEKQKQGDAVAGGGDDSWNPALHPWRPFDRDKDLGVGPQAYRQGSAHEVSWRSDKPLW